MLCAMLGPLPKHENWKMSRKRYMGDEMCGIVFVQNR